jgi:S1-C subfamily serine protease
MRARAWKRGAAGIRRLAFAALLMLVAGPVLAQGTLSALETDVDQIGRIARSSVVTVIARNSAQHDPSAGAAKVSKRTYTRIGSGVAVGETEIITTASVVLDAEHVWIRTSNDLQVEARLVGLDPVSNLALLRVSDLRLPALKFAQGRAAREGDWTMAIGTARYNRERIAQSVGAVAARLREPRLALLQLTNWVHPGFSGGAVVNARGELVGILQGELETPGRATALDAGDRSPGGVSFMLPVESIKPIYESLRAEGHVRHGYFGVSARAASVESDTRVGLQVPIGALVESVIPDGPAAKLGLKRGDLIVSSKLDRMFRSTIDALGGRHAPRRVDRSRVGAQRHRAEWSRRVARVPGRTPRVGAAGDRQCRRPRRADAHLRAREADSKAQS